MRLALIIEYEGTEYSGFQFQENARTIQGELEKSINCLTGDFVRIKGAGRTDSGVHAIAQSAHFDTKRKINNLVKFLKSINHFVNKKDISILKIKKKNLNFHARFSAKQRIYKYIIFNRLSTPSIEKKRGWHISKKLDINLMKKGAKKLLGTKDFSTFRSSGCNAKSPIKTMKSIKIKSAKDKIEIQFKSQSFLQQQVRSMVGCLKYLGEKKWNLKKFERIFKSKKRTLCAPPAPPHGLFLEKIIY